MASTSTRGEEAQSNGATQLTSVSIKNGLSSYPATAQVSGMENVRTADVVPEEKDVASLPPVEGYEILGVLGRGGMGVVYKAMQIRLKRLVALKMILAGAHTRAQELRRFKTEAEAVARLQHPNIVQIHEIGEQNGHPYLSLEYVDGGNLAERLTKSSLAPVEAAQFLEKVARAMHFAHVRGVIHRDLKPANILLTSDGQPKITDFGLAKQLDSEQGQTRSGAIMGTPSYMAPEQARGDLRAIGPVTDVYALGSILYELIAGAPPFAGQSVMETIDLVVHEDPPPPSTHKAVPRDLETICLKCLEKEGHRRYQSAEELAEDLRRFLAHETITARPATVWERSGKWLRRHPTHTTLIAACIVGIIGGTIAVLSQLQTEQRRRQDLAYQVEAARAEVREFIQRAEQAVDNAAWDNAQELARSIHAKVDLVPELTSFKTDTGLMAVDQRLSAHNTYKQFTELRDNAIFHATLASGDNRRDNLAKSRAFAEQALTLVGLSSGADAELVLPDSFSKTERDEIGQGCYHLLLMVADIVAQPQPRQPPEAIRQQARDALRILDRADKLGAQTMAYHLRRARYLTQAGSSGADKERERAEQFPPMSAREHYLLGEERYQHGEIIQSATDFAEAIHHEPTFFWARYFLSLCYLRLGQASLARDNLSACLGQKEMVWIYLLRGFAHGQLGNYQSADEDFESALRLRANVDAQYVLYNNRAVMRIGQKRFETAIQDLERAITLKPNQYQAFATLAQVYHQQRNLAAAIDKMNRAVDIAERLVKADELNPLTLALLYRTRSRFHVERGDVQEALADLRKLVALEPGEAAALAKAHAEIGRLLQRGNQFEDALCEFEASLAVSQDNPETHRWQAEALLKAHRYQDAIEAMDAYLKHGGKPSARIYQARGLAKARLHDLQAAIEDLTLALQMEPGDAALRNARGHLFLSTQAYQLALRDFNDVLRQAPGDAAALAGRGLTHAKLGHDREAVADAEHALQGGPLTSRLAYQAARVYAQAVGKLDAESVKWSSRSIMARSRYQERALVLLRQALELLPPDQRAVFWSEVIQGEMDLHPISRAPEFVQMKHQYVRDSRP